MNENLNLTKILKNCPKGTAFYSSVHGKLYYDDMYVDSSASKIYFKSTTSHSIGDSTSIIIIYLPDGRLYNGEGECTIFPSKDQRDWNKFSAPWYKKEKFDPKTLQTLDKVLVKTYPNTEWNCDLFSTMLTNPNDYFFPYIGFNGMYKQCIPLNDETKHLIGTSDEAPEYYRYWEK